MCRLAAHALTQLVVQAAKNAQLRVTTAEQVTTLLTRSARVFADLTNYFEFRFVVYLYL